MKTKILSLLILSIISIINLKGQDYLINFAGSGATTTVTTVRVENLTQSTNLTLSGSDVLHLINTATGIRPINQNQNSQISFSPNPMADYSKMQFDLPEPGNTVIELYDISGRRLAQTQNSLSKGKHTYRIQGLDKGLYFVKISSDKYSFSGRFVCSGSANGDAKIVYENSTITQEKQNLSKGINAEFIMQYTTGDRLKLSGISGNYSTVKTDIPTSGKTITFNFMPCTDIEGNNYSVVEIGSQVWMAENLRTKTYKNGNPILTTANASGDPAPKYQWVYNDNESNAVTYGRLYTWFTLTDNRGVCPTGWHVPSDAEFTILSEYLIHNGSGYGNSGDLIGKSLGSTWGWNTDLTPGNIGNDPTSNNSTGFSALAGGFRNGSGNYVQMGEAGHWRSATEGNTIGISAWYRSLNSNYGIFYRNDYGNYSGQSVRCLKNN